MKFYQRLKSLLLFIVISVFPGMAIEAYQIPEFGMYIQYRHNEDGSEYNRLYFEIQDDAGDWISDGNVVTDVKLFDPNDAMVNIVEVGFGGLIDFIAGRFNLTSGQWEFDASYPISGFYYNFSEPLISGQYRLEVTTTEGQLPDKLYTFNQQVDDFPFFSSRTFEIYHDTAGNVYWSWDLPKDAIATAETYSTSIRAFVDVYNGETETALLWPTVPTHMNSLFIPNTVVQELVSKGDKFKFIVSFRTNDNQNRSYSKSITVTDMLTTVPKKKQVAVIPLF